LPSCFINLPNIFLRRQTNVFSRVVTTQNQTSISLICVAAF